MAGSLTEMIDYDGVDDEYDDVVDAVDGFEDDAQL